MRIIEGVTRIKDGKDGLLITEFRTDEKGDLYAVWAVNSEGLGQIIPLFMLAMMEFEPDTVEVPK